LNGLEIERVQHPLCDQLIQGGPALESSATVAL